jgi:F-type H+-transporting ATPase subunit c
MKKRDENYQLEMLEGAKSIGAGAATIASAGAAIGIGNVFSSLIHSVARNPSLAKQSFGYAILGFALTEAIASFAPMMAFLISSVFRSRLKFHSYNSLFEADSSLCSFYRYCKSQLMFPLDFHYEDVSRQDPLLKSNHAGSSRIV